MQLRNLSTNSNMNMLSINEEENTRRNSLKEFKVIFLDSEGIQDGKDVAGSAVFLLLL